MFLSNKICSFFIIFFSLFLCVLASCGKGAGKEQEQSSVPQDIRVEIRNETESVLYINNSFYFTPVGTFKEKYGDGIRNIYSINKMPSRLNDKDEKIPYMVLLPSQKITVLVPQGELRESEDVALWVCRENLEQKNGSLPTMSEYVELLLQSGGIRFSFWQQAYNIMYFKITDERTMPVTEKAISDISDFVKTDFYDKWIMRDGTVYCNMAYTVPFSPANLVSSIPRENPQKDWNFPKTLWTSCAYPRRMEACEEA